jgi:hypothetical protein
LIVKEFELTQEGCKVIEQANIDKDAEVINTKQIALLQKEIEHTKNLRAQ